MSVLLAALLLAAPGADARPATPPPVQPYRVDLPDGGFVDWYEGRVGAIGRVRIFRDIERNRGAYKLTRSEAEAKSRELALRTLAGISIDGAARVGDREDVMDWARRWLEDEEPTSVGRVFGSFFDAVLEAPLRGEEGALSMLLPADGPRPDRVHQAVSAPAGPGKEESAPPVSTGLIIDARLLPEDRVPEPALLPRIVDAGGRVVHDASRVDPDFAREYGLVTYAVSASGGSNEPDAASATRIGPRPLIVDAVPADGDPGTDVVVSAADADRIVAAASGEAFLQECRVIVLMPPPRFKPKQVVPPRYLRRPHAPRPADPNEPGRKE